MEVPSAVDVPALCQQSGQRQETMA